jgi:hypothetical protein
MKLLAVLVVPLLMAAISEARSLKSGSSPSFGRSANSSAVSVVQAGFDYNEVRIRALPP